MGLSQSRRVRRPAAQKRLAEFSSPAFAQKFLAANRWTLQAVDQTLRRAIQHYRWLSHMHKQLDITVNSLRQNPSSAIQAFQAILSRPSYFQAKRRSTHWVLLFGPSTQRLIVQPMLNAAPAISVRSIPRSFDFIAAPSVPGVHAARRVRRYAAAAGRIVVSVCGASYRWLMHPLVDTREPS